MENTELLSAFELIDNIEFEEKVDIEDLVLLSEPTGILKVLRQKANMLLQTSTYLK